MSWFRKADLSRPSFGDRGATFEPRATEGDIAACFRLILGRLPNAEEWRGHAMRVGENLDGVVASYVNSLEFSRRGVLQQDHLGAITLADLPDFRIYTDADDAAVGQHVRTDNYERDVTAVFRRLLHPGMGVIDIGANIGYFTMLSAALVGAAGLVFAIEPNPRNARLLEASRRANGFDQVRLLQSAAGADTGLLVLHRAHSNGTTSAPPDDVNDLLGAETVPCVPVDALVPRDRRIDLIKADVEGAEYLALRGCAGIIERWRPAIISEFSPGLMPGISGIEGAAYLAWIIDRGYRLAVIQPDGACLPATSAADVMAHHAARVSDHVDILATPV